jgi:predicted metalloprotease with PDZ domain
MQAGIYADDEIAALDGLKCDASGLIARCEEKKPGDQVRVSLFRRERLLEVPVTLGPKPNDTAYLARLESATDAQKLAYRAWIGASWDESENKS